MRAIDVACDVARDIGVAVVALHDAGHLGALAGYVERAAARGNFAMVVSASEPGVVVPGKAEATFGTNALAFGWPAHPVPVVADFATSAISRSALLRVLELGGTLPPGVAVDSSGEVTTDPRAALDGGLLPIGGGHKGLLISLLTGMLAGPVVGGPPCCDVKGTRNAGAPHRADLFWAVDLGLSAGREQFAASAGKVTAALEGSGWYAPGSGAHAREVRTANEGVVLSHKTSALLREAL